MGAVSDDDKLSEKRKASDEIMTAVNVYRDLIPTTDEAKSTFTEDETANTRKEVEQCLADMGKLALRRIFMHFINDLFHSHFVKLSVFALSSVAGKAVYSNANNERKRRHPKKDESNVQHEPIQLVVPASTSDNNPKKESINSKPLARQETKQKAKPTENKRRKRNATQSSRPAGSSDKIQPYVASRFPQWHFAVPYQPIVFPVQVPITAVPGQQIGVIHPLTRQIVVATVPISIYSTGGVFNVFA